MLTSDAGNTGTAAPSDTRHGGDHRHGGRTTRRCNTVPGAQTVAEDTNLSITGLSVSDVDAGSATITTTLSVLNGTLTVVSAGGAAVAGSGTGSVTLTGTVAQINTTLAAANNVVYKGVANFNGSDTLTVLTNDAGNTGTGGPLPDSDTVAITVTAVERRADDYGRSFVPGCQEHTVCSDHRGFSCGRSR